MLHSRKQADSRGDYRRRINKPRVLLPVSRAPVRPAALEIVDVHNLHWSLSGLDFGGISFFRQVRLLELFLEFNPFVDFAIRAVQQQELPSFKKFRQEKETHWDTQERHQRESNSDWLEVLHKEDQSKRHHFQHGVTMNPALLHVLGVVSLWVDTGLLEEEQESVPELNAAQTGKTHEQEYSVQDGQRQEFQRGQKEHDQSQQEMSKQSRQSCFLRVTNVAILVLFGQCIHVNNARDGSSHQPW